MVKCTTSFVPTELGPLPSTPPRAPRVKPISFERKMRAFLKEFARKPQASVADKPAHAECQA